MKTTTISGLLSLSFFSSPRWKQLALFTLFAPPCNSPSRKIARSFSTTYSSAQPDIGASSPRALIAQGGFSIPQLRAALPDATNLHDPQTHPLYIYRGYIYIAASLAYRKYKPTPPSVRDQYGGQTHRERCERMALSSPPATRIHDVDISWARPTQFAKSLILRASYIFRLARFSPSIHPPILYLRFFTLPFAGQTFLHRFSYSSSSSCISIFSDCSATNVFCFFVEKSSFQEFSFFSSLHREFSKYRNFVFSCPFFGGD